MPTIDYDKTLDANAVLIKEQLAELAALRADAERLEWYFGPASKADWLDTFMTGVRENWTVDQWRAAIDAAIAKAGK